MTSQHPTELFVYDPDWHAFASKHELPVPSNSIPPPALIEPLDVDFSAARPYQAQQDAEWAAAHPLSSVGYRSRLISVTVRDGAQVSVKVSCPDPSRLRARDDSTLPVLFVNHGGGWVSGSHVSEEAWLLWPLYRDFDLVIISVEYRLAPEHKFPVWIDDSTDVLEKVFADSGSFVQGLGVSCDLSCLILAGSSSGAGITAVLSQNCRDRGLRVAGVVLNVPVLCHYRHYPASEDGVSGSYKECAETFMGSREMATCWSTVTGSRTLGADPRLSPLLGDSRCLPPHVIFVAGRDPLRDEGIAYSRLLEGNGVDTRLHVYKGVPHNFAHNGELESTRRFWQDLRSSLKQWVPPVREEAT